MPCHPDRVRRNYHDVQAAMLEMPAQCAYEARFYVTKREVASWMDPRMMIDCLLRKFRDLLIETYKVRTR